MTVLRIEQAEELARRALAAAGASEAMARSTARALVAAEAEGLGSHGLSRVPQYASFLRNGRADGDAVPAIVADRAACALVDARDGLAFPACELAVATAIAKARDAGVAFVAVTNSHHFGVAAHHLEEVAAAGMVGLALGNSPAAMPVPGGRRALLGTNPIAAAFPRPGADPLVIDLSLSEVARGKVMLAAREKRAIPPGWALDAQGEPTTDAQAALAGSMLPFGSGAGGVKGGMLALIVELLVTTLTGARFGAEADSFFVDAGNRPRIGQAFLAIDPRALAGRGVYDERIEALVAAMLDEPGVRLPGARRRAIGVRAGSAGIEIGDALLAQLEALAKGG
ncbi:MAG: Ldh family oxidoreductase [Burkholderiaceae bacterium]|nr:Ldh family oxidoreductase [Burkholderiaceae bacterium]